MTITLITLLCLIAFFSGLVDAIAGGGGLLQVPLSLILMPNLPVATVIGTLKIPSFSGTALAAYSYSNATRIRWRETIIMQILAFFMAMLGSEILSNMKNTFMKPVLLVVLALVAVYTFRHKKFGTTKNKLSLRKNTLPFAILIALIIGFYDGFIGPGTGSFLILSFITLMGMDFLNASAEAKMVNLATNLGSILLFSAKGTIIWKIAIPLAVCNAIGGWTGARLAIKKGNGFIRTVFLIMVILTLARFAYDSLR